MQETLIDIFCPKCSEKAQFHSVLTGTYKIDLERSGFITCKQCGFNGPHCFSNKDYFYQIPVGERILFAKNRIKLIALRDYFQKGYTVKPKHDPETDFPKEFYKHKHEIVKRINSILANE